MGDVGIQLEAVADPECDYEEVLIQRAVEHCSLLVEEHLVELCAHISRSTYHAELFREFVH